MSNPIHRLPDHDFETGDLTDAILVALNEVPPPGADDISESSETGEILITLPNARRFRLQLHEIPA